MEYWKLVGGWIIGMILGHLFLLLWNWLVDLNAKWKREEKN